MDQNLRRTLGSPERARDLPVVHSECESHDHRLTPVVRQRPAPPPALAQLLPALDQLLRVVGLADHLGVLQHGGRLARTVAVVVRREVVGDADQPRTQRPAVRLALSALEVPVRLDEGLRGEVLGVVMVAGPVVRVVVDVAQVLAVEVRELAVERGLVGRSCHVRERTPRWHASPGDRLSRRGGPGSALVRRRATLGPRPALDQRRELVGGGRLDTGARIALASRGTRSSASDVCRAPARLLGTLAPRASSSPARRLRLCAASTVATRSPAPASPAKL